LPERRRAHVDGRGSVRIHVDTGELLRGEPGDLDVRGHADAERAAIATLPARSLFATEGVVPGELEGSIQRRDVIPAVVLGAGAGGERERVGRDQVPAPDLDGIQLELGR